MAELKKIDVVQGTGAEAKSGPVTVHYTGWLHDPAAADGHGKKFDSSVQLIIQRFSVRTCVGLSRYRRADRAERRATT